MTDPVLRRHHVQLRGGDGPPLVFVHGLGTDQRAWRFVAPAFDRDHRVVLLDRIGAGAADPTAWDDRRHGSLDGHAADLLDVLRVLDLPPATVVGHSVGGAIALLAALRQPQRIARLVLVAVSPHFLEEPDYPGALRREDVDSLLDLLEANQYDFAGHLAPMAMGPEAGAALTDELDRGLRGMDPWILRRFAHQVFHVDIRDRVSEVAVPTTVVQCLRDHIVPPAVGRWMHARIGGSRLVELDIAGHCPHMSHPHRVVDAIRDALSS